MSNAIDVLCIGGPADGIMYNFKRNRVTKVLAFPTRGGEVLYKLRNWQSPITGKWYHIATRADNEPTDEEIAVTIVMCNFTPAWDLNA